MCSIIDINCKFDCVTHHQNYKEIAICNHFWSTESEWLKRMNIWRRQKLRLDEWACRFADYRLYLVPTCINCLHPFGNRKKDWLNIAIWVCRIFLGWAHLNVPSGTLRLLFLDFSKLPFYLLCNAQCVHVYVYACVCIHFHFIACNVLFLL